MGLFSKAPKDKNNTDASAPSSQAAVNLTVDSLNEAEQNVFKGYRTNAKMVFDALDIHPDNDGLYSTDQCQTAATAWLQQDPKIAALGLPADEYAFAIGVSWGDTLNAKCGSQWVVVQDEYGTAYAIYKAANQGRGFPYQIAFKAISGEYGEHLLDTAAQTTLDLLNA